ncbi:FecR domain-containing protein [Planctomycetota bacterium]
MNKNERLKQIACYIAGTLDADGVKELETALQQDSELRRDYLEYLNIDAAVAEIAVLPDSETVEMCSRSKLMGRWSRWMYLAIAASILCMISLWGWISHQAADNVPSDVMATVLYTEDLKLEGHVRDVQVGDRLTLSHVQVNHGLLGLELSTGVKLELIGPLAGSFAGPARLHLASGRLNADVGEHGKGFTVVTKAGEVVDLGTEFGVDVDESGAARVAVFSGQVSVRKTGKNKTSKSVTMWDGEALSLRTDKKPNRLSSVNIRAHKMELDAAGKSDMIESVTDNIKDKDFRKFYGIVAQGLAEGTVAYTNRPGVKWMAEPGTSITPRLQGADVVCPFHVDRHRNDLNITLQLKQASTVYVLWDKRRRPLPWLKDNFKRTQIRLYSGPWGLPWGKSKMPVVRGIEPDAQGRMLLEYTVWCREVLESGPLTLGPPHNKKEKKRPGGFAMYGIAVQPLDTTFRSPQLPEETKGVLTSTEAPSP